MQTQETIRSWHFSAQTALGERMLSRVLQVLETQLVRPSYLSLRERERSTGIDFVVDTDSAKAQRIGRLLRRMDRFRSVDWYPVSMSDTETSTAQTAIATRVHARFSPSLDADGGFWRTCPSVHFTRDAYGKEVEGHETEVRLAWSEERLFLLFLCHYEELNLRNGIPQLDAPTEELWNNDVAELFIHPGTETVAQYKEFEISPRAEWIALNIETREPGVPLGAPLRSESVYSAQIDEAEHLWTAMMQIPVAALGCEALQAGMEFRINLFRSQGKTPLELAWQPTMHRSFHVPSRFGRLVLTEN